MFCLVKPTWSDNLREKTSEHLVRTCFRWTLLYYEFWEQQKKLFRREHGLKQPEQHVAHKKSYEIIFFLNCCFHIHGSVLSHLLCTFAFSQHFLSHNCGFIKWARNSSLGAGESNTCLTNFLNTCLTNFLSEGKDNFTVWCSIMPLIFLKCKKKKKKIFFWVVLGAL